jgi:hypothetical protein
VVVWGGWAVRPLPHSLSLSLCLSFLFSCSRFDNEQRRHGGQQHRAKKEEKQGKQRCNKGVWCLERGEDG